MPALLRLALLLALLPADPAPATGRELWPMDEGRFWRYYRVGGPADERGERQLIVRAILNLRLHGIETPVAEILDCHDENWRYAYFAYESEGRPGIFKLPNAYLGGERGANIDAAPRPLLPGPGATTWSWSEVWGIQTAGHSSHLPPLEDLTLSFTGRAQEEAVTVPAGAFQALHMTLEGQGALHGAHRYEYWFVRGVGPVKIIEDAERWELIEHGPGRRGERSMKGWELHVRADGDDYRFGYLHGTNRLKTAAEIEAALHIRGLKALSAELEKLAVDEEVFLITPPEWEGSEEGAKHKQRLREALGLEAKRLSLRISTGC